MEQPGGTARFLWCRDIENILEPIPGFSSAAQFPLEFLLAAISEDEQTKRRARTEDGNLILEIMSRGFAVDLQNDVVRL